VPDVASVVLVQKFTYRDQPEEWSNRYHLNGGAPADATELQAIADAIFDLLAPALTTAVSLVRAYGYSADGEHASSSVDYTVSPLTPPQGSFASGTVSAPGDSAATVRWPTGRVNSRGKAIYLRKYFHGIRNDPSDFDKLYGSELTAMQAFADGMLDELGSTGQFMAGPDGVVPIGAHADPYLTTRTLKRRGRRPPT
jgi:hypothetical protein